MFVYPVLHVHTIPYETESCEQVAFGSQPPLFTVQLSKNSFLDKYQVFDFNYQN